jgi:hypothetical protein
LLAVVIVDRHRIVRQIGIGLDFIANMNREVSTFGWVLTVSGGWLR